MASTRCITLGNGRRVSLGGYVRAWREVRARAAAEPDFEYTQGLDGLGSRTAAEVLAQFRRGMVARINERIPVAARGRRAVPPYRPPAWRKLDPSWQAWARRAAHDVNTPRLIVRPHGVPRELRARLAHRLEGAA